MTDASSWTSSLFPPLSAAVFDSTNPVNPLGEGIGFASGIGGLATGTLTGLVQTTMGKVVALVGLMATVAVIVAGLYLILGFGDDSSRDKAKNIILYTIIGIGIIALATSIINFVFYLLGTGGNTQLRTDVIEIVKRVLNFLALAAVVIVVSAGVRLLLSMGEEEQKDKAKKTIIYALLGLFVVFVARVIVAFATNYLFK